jgi:ATP-dependent protease HslVU (ClpYQ) peptidase subunit
MSVIVGVKEKDVIYIGADSQITKGGSKKSQISPNNRKVWHPDDIDSLLMGSVGLIRGINIIKTINGLIDQKTLSDHQIDYDYVINHVSSKLMEKMEEHKLIESKDFNPKMQNEFLFAYKDSLYLIGSEASVIQIDDYIAIGSGSIEAMGNLSSTEKEDPITRITKAIQAAIENDIYVDYPIIIMNTKDKNVIIIQEKNKAIID